MILRTVSYILENIILYNNIRVTNIKTIVCPAPLVTHRNEFVGGRRRMRLTVGRLGNVVSRTSPKGPIPFHGEGMWRRRDARRGNQWDLQIFDWNKLEIILAVVIWVACFFETSCWSRDSSKLFIFRFENLDVPSRCWLQYVSRFIFVLELLT